MGSGEDDISAARQKREARAGQAAKSRILSQSEYEHRELVLAQRGLTEIRRAPLSDRREAQGAFFEAMRDQPEIVGERVGWLLDGNYGYGQMLLAKRVLGSPRANRVAALTQLIGAYEWQSPEDMSRAAWKKLSAGERTKLNSAVQAAIDGALAEEP
jgi:hypothetical protein